MVGNGRQLADVVQEAGSGGFMVRYHFRAFGIIIIVRLKTVRHEQTLPFVNPNTSTEIHHLLVNRVLKVLLKI